MSVSDVPSEFANFYSAAEDVALKALTLGSKLMGGTLKPSEMQAIIPFTFLKGLIRSDGNDYNTILLWRGEDMKHCVYTRSLYVYFLSIGVYPDVGSRCGPVHKGAVLQENIAKIDGKHMPVLGERGEDNFSLYSEDNLFRLSWKVGSHAMLVTRHNSCIEIACFKPKDGLADHLQRKCEGAGAECDQWILHKDNHFYFLDTERARRSIECAFGMPGEVFPGNAEVEAAKAREEALFHAFATGTHWRLGNGSVLGQYLSQCIVPLHLIFLNRGLASVSD
jgi:hypothetical protein